MPAELTCRVASALPYARVLRADALKLLRILALDHCELSLMLVSDSGIRRLNRDFRGKDQATDVLSFPQLEPDRACIEPTHPDTHPTAHRQRHRRAKAATVPPLALGDVVISVDTARRQARELGQSTAARIRTLLIHGLLHLLGYDHERSAAEARRMFAREHELAAYLDKENGLRPRSRRATAARANEADGLRWSPAAMPQNLKQCAKKSAANRKPTTPPLNRNGTSAAAETSRPDHRR